MSGPYGDFHPIFNSKKEMIWVGGGAGMAPLRSQIMHMTKTLNVRDRELHYFTEQGRLQKCSILMISWN